MEDSYEFLPKKIFLAFQWCFENFPLCKGVFKTDEDILISDMKEFTESLLENKETLYWGLKCEKTTETFIKQERINSRFENTKLKRFKIPGAHYCYGHGYWLSAIAWNKICENIADFSLGLEDVLIGKALNDKKIFPIQISLPYSEINREPVISFEYDEIVAYVISLPERYQKFQDIEKNWKHIFDKIVRVNGIRSPVPHAGCGLAHISAIRYALEANPEKPAIVLEDDVIPHESLTKERFLRLYLDATRLQKNFDAVYLKPITECSTVRMRKTDSEYFLDFEPHSYVFCNAFMLYSPRCLRFLDVYEKHLLTEKIVIPIDRLFTSNKFSFYDWNRPNSLISVEHNCILRNTPTDNGSSRNFSTSHTYLDNMNKLKQCAMTSIKTPKENHEEKPLQIQVFLSRNIIEDSWLLEGQNEDEYNDSNWIRIGTEGDSVFIRVPCKLRYGNKNKWIIKNFQACETELVIGNHLFGFDPDPQQKKCVERFID